MAFCRNDNVVHVFECMYVTTPHVHTNHLGTHNASDKDWEAP